MVSETRKSGLRVIPFTWLVLALIMAFGAGYCYVISRVWWILFALCSGGCGVMMIKSLRRLNKSLRYLIDATLNGDFLYKFPTVNVNRDERDINIKLNCIVEHFEHLSTEARQNEAFLERVINLMDIGLAVADSKGDIRFYNEAALRLLDRPVLTHVCQIPENLYPNLVIKKNELTVKEKCFTLYTISDLSRRMQEVEVESWEKLTRVLTHEIMNSLTPIQSIAETMSSKESDTEISEAFNAISSSSGSLMRFVKNFREFRQLPKPHMKVLYLKPILESCVRLGEGYVGDRSIAFSLLCFPPEVMVYTDETLLSRVILNILKNAIEASPTVITIEAEVKAEESVEIRISNDGEPIPDATAEHIFTPFFTTRASGSGIGLSLSRRIINHLGGTLSFKTKPLTCFIIRI